MQNLLVTCTLRRGSYREPMLLAVVTPAFSNCAVQRMVHPAQRLDRRFVEYARFTAISAFGGL